MKILEQRQDRQDYLRIQIERSQSKFGYCKVSYHDVARYKEIIDLQCMTQPERKRLGPILCLGTRNGREVDLFRTVFWGSSFARWATRSFEQYDRSFRSALPLLESFGRSDWRAIGPQSVIGVEINPMGERSDIWIGSFDEMPPEWSGRFDIIFSNSFDQSQDPFRTAHEWRRIARPDGFLIFCFSSQSEPNAHDPVAGITRDDVIRLFGNDLVYYRKSGSAVRYHEAILRLALSRKTAGEA